MYDSTRGSHGQKMGTDRLVSKVCKGVENN